MAPQDRLDVLILGSGGREHALLKACLRSPRVARVRVAPGNGGMALEAECLDVDAANPAAVLELVRRTAANFVIVGPEVPLAAGVVDALEAAGIPAYGPLAAGARLEASKAFSKDFMVRHRVPTAASATFHQLAPALAYVRSQPVPIVIKASGLAAGKGVVIATTLAEAEAALRDMMETKVFGASGDEVVIEEFMQGEEASIMLMVCGEEYLMLPPSQDHKRVGEGDTGLNTGGMGAYAPTTVVTPEVERRLREEIILPTLRGLKADGIDYRGTLYVGIMVTAAGPKVVEFNVRFTAAGPKVVEFNVRFGDPECQVLMPSLETDPVQIMEDIAHGRFRPAAVKLRPGATIIVVLAAGGYRRRGLSGRNPQGRCHHAADGPARRRRHRPWGHQALAQWPSRHHRGASPRGRGPRGDLAGGRPAGLRGRSPGPLRGMPLPPGHRPSPTQA
ncbi:MAG: hypothetical protein RL304_1086 [Verrucomicrobiota bacterium]